MIGFGQTVNKDAIIKNMNDTIDELERKLLDCQVEVETMYMEDMNDDCCQSGVFPEDSIIYWANGNKKELRISHNEGLRNKPYREWYKNGEIKRIYVYGDCEFYHELFGIICFDRNTREIVCEDD